MIDHVRRRYPASTMFAAGWSLGANILVNYLGEQGPDTPLEAAVSMCNPFDLTISNRHINEVWHTELHHKGLTRGGIASHGLIATY